MRPRELVVNRLVDEALSGMRNSGEDFSADEMLSACLTLARRAIIVILEMRPGARQIVQGAIESLLMDCVDETKIN